MGEEKGSIKNRLVILPGLRGVGKTTILFQLYDYLTNNKGIEREQILYFSTDELKAFLNKKVLEVIDVFIRDFHKTTPVYLDKELFILIDEAHFDKSWSEAAKILFDQSKKIFMIFTGSSALNFELNVDAARRATKEIVFPMNFSEYLILKYKWFPPSRTAKTIRDVIFYGENADILEEAIKKENELVKTLINLEKPSKQEWERLYLL